jgi:hypothetical protein
MSRVVTITGELYSNIRVNVNDWDVIPTLFKGIPVNNWSAVMASKIVVTRQQHNSKDLPLCSNAKTAEQRVWGKPAELSSVLWIISDWSPFLNV